MKRALSQLLVFSLFVVVPVSFSTDNIPSLDAPCLKTKPLTQSRKATISIFERTVRLRLRPKAIAFQAVKPVFFTTMLSFLSDGCLQLPQGRAPPVSSFV